MKKKALANSETFCEIYYSIFLFICKDNLKRTGKELSSYKHFEPEYLKNIYIEYVDEKEIIKQISKLLSKLIIIQALPNANHRTAFFLMRVYSRMHGIRMKLYDEDIEYFNKFYDESKRIIGTDINHSHLFDDNYFDSQHSHGIEEHLKCSTNLIRKILVKPQSGIRTVESFHSFIARLNQAGSLPSSNP
jgi:hypothetical protein